MTEAPLTLPVRPPAQGAGDRTDPQLLHDFAARADQAAFAQIVRRHGPAVFGVCRRVLQNRHDAEDAFQATFLVLARNAGSIRNAESLGGWLHGVSFRLAMQARRDAARRRKHETRARPAHPDPGSDLAWREVQAVLDEEVERLAPIHRSAFVLCCLQGLTQAEAARQLGVKEGTVSSRLAHARRRLQEALARRGITLTSLLAAVALSGGARASLPRGLLRRATQTATRAAAGQTEGLSGNVLTLAEGATQTMFSAKVKLATALLLAAGLIGLGASALPRTAATASASAHAAPPTPKEPPRGSEKESSPLAPASPLTGRVLGPDGKPIPGAKVSLWRPADGPEAEPRARSTADAEGRFRLEVKPEDEGPLARIIATAEGLGPDWARLDEARKSKDLTLRLVRDDHPVECRVLDLEGRPLPGIKAKIQSVGQKKGGDLDAWAEAQKGKPSLMGNDFYRVRPEALGVSPHATTDKGGEFRLEGIGRDRLVRLVLSGPGVESTLLSVLTRPGPARGWKPGQDGLYPATCTLALAPEKPIIGTVRDKQTGKPIPGITVASPGHLSATATTDAEGDYRISGVGKRKEYWVAAGGRSYLNVTKFGVLDTPGLEPLRVDFELQRGIAVRGRLLDRSTGKPVPGRVSYAALPDNPHRKDYPDLDKPQYIAVDSGKAGPDGSFTVLAIPGRGALCATADDHDGYARDDPGGINLGRLILEQYHTIVPIDLPVKGPAPEPRDVTVAPGRSLPGRLVDPDGNPVPGARAAGLSPIPKLFGGQDALAGAEFTVGGLGPDEPRPLLFVHPEKKLARLLNVPADAKGPLTVHLEPLTPFTGRLLDADGRPWAGVEVTARMWLYEEKGLDRFPPEIHLHYPHWSTFTDARATTDAEGRFRIEGVVPGLPYVVTANDPKGDGRTATHEGTRTAEAGKPKDLGDLRPVPRTPK